MLDEVVEAVARLSVPRVTEGSTSLIGLPILLDDELIGVIGLTRAEVGLFSDEEVEIVTLALQAHEAFAVLAAGWRKRGTGLGLGIGIAAGYATIGRIGFEGRYDYGALGRATNLAARLSTHAGPARSSSTLRSSLRSRAGSRWSPRAICT